MVIYSESNTTFINIRWSTYRLTQDYLPSPPIPASHTPFGTVIRGAIAGTTLAMIQAVPTGSPCIFPDHPSEFTKDFPRMSRTSVLLRGALGHAAFFTVYEGLVGAVVRGSANKQRKEVMEGNGTNVSKPQQDQEMAMEKYKLMGTRFVGGGVAALAYKAATATMTRELERVVTTGWIENAKVLGRSFVVAGLVMAGFSGIEEMVTKNAAVGLASAMVGSADKSS
ncbi:hypothetical protein HDU76_013827 [Blyttiomyces sp. JEL0837]|nr:hypothetical protein HDU76_013827 [Blyttiomyces sp. JEL0837]